MDLGPDQNPRSQSLVRSWMRTNKWQYIDLCNECNYTRFAEDAAEQYNLYVDENDFEIPQWVFDMAVIIGDEEINAND